MKVEVGGNCRGLSVIEQAVENAYSQLPDALYDDTKTMTLINKNGDELSSAEDDEDEWLQHMLIAAEIIDIQPEKKGRKRRGYKEKK